MWDAQVEWENALNLCVAHPLKNHKSQNISVIYDLQLISYTSKFKTVPCLITDKSCVSEVKLCFRNSQIPYLTVNSIFKKFFVIVIIYPFYDVLYEVNIHCFLLSIQITVVSALSMYSTKSSMREELSPLTSPRLGSVLF